MEFCTKKERIVIDYVPFTVDQFINTLNAHKPREIFNPPYSTKSPCWIITDYLENGSVKYFADGWYNKTPVEVTMERLYRKCISQGLTNCHIIL